MAFQSVTAHTPPEQFISIRTKRDTGWSTLTFNRTALAKLGNPRAVAFEWDPDESLMRISAADPADPTASTLPSGSRQKYVTVTRLLRTLGIPAMEHARFPVVRDSATAVIADLSDAMALAP